MQNIESTFTAVIQSISSMEEILSAGRSGGRPLPTSPEGGDIDVFLYCDAIPGEDKRRAALASLGDALQEVRVGAFSGGHWGTGDFARIGGVETWLMYMTRAEALAEVESILNGDRPGREGYYFPTGRCAMYLGMEILCDKTGFLAALKDRLSVYPESLSLKLANIHRDALGDTEDFERAVARKDALFYHFAMDIALDHFLQALFAMNKTFFPSRKRSLEYIDGFGSKPEKCGERLLEAVRLGGSPDSLGRSYEIWAELIKELDK